MTDPKVLAITDHVAPADRDRYEALVAELHGLFRQQPGFLSVDTVRHVQPHRAEYTVLLRFADERSATAAQRVPEIVAKVAEIQSITGGAAQVVEAAGLELWVDHAAGSGSALPPFWKRVSLGVLGVYPSLMVLMILSEPLIGALPQPVQVFLLVAVLSTLLTWPIMPFLSRALQPWLIAGSRP